MRVPMRCPFCDWSGERHHTAKKCGRCGENLERVKGPTILPTPALLEQWKINLRNFSMRVGFTVSLSRAMLEYLCAVADGVQWDRSVYHYAQPDNWIASQRSLEKRGLIVLKSDEEFAAMRDSRRDDIGSVKFYEWSRWKLSPAGEAVVQLVKLAGLFVEADAAINKKARRA